MIPELKAARWLNLYQRQATLEQKLFNMICAIDTKMHQTHKWDVIGTDQIICLIKGLILPWTRFLRPDQQQQHVALSACRVNSHIHFSWTVPPALLCAAIWNTVWQRVRGAKIDPCLCPDTFSSNRQGDGAPPSFISIHCWSLRRKFRVSWVEVWTQGVCGSNVCPKESVFLWLWVYMVGCVRDWGCKQKQNLFTHSVLNSKLCIAGAYEVEFCLSLWLSQELWCPVLSQNLKTLFHLLCWWSFSVLLTQTEKVWRRLSHLNIGQLWVREPFQEPLKELDLLSHWTTHPLTSGYCLQWESQITLQGGPHFQAWCSDAWVFVIWAPNSIRHHSSSAQTSFQMIRRWVWKRHWSKT